MTTFNPFHFWTENPTEIKYIQQHCFQFLYSLICYLSYIQEGSWMDSFWIKTWSLKYCMLEAELNLDRDWIENMKGITCDLVGIMTSHIGIALICHKTRIYCPFICRQCGYQFNMQREKHMGHWPQQEYNLSILRTL